jgi:FG-GAP-like repeat/Abnormal spindle-like microcephaly-assoc'd, ASPM-SPD-2-Hydin
VDGCGQTCGFVSILIGNGDGTFQAKTDYAVGQSPVALVVQDFNGDGRFDLAVTNTSKSVSVLLGKGDGSFQPAVNYISNTSPWGIVSADFDGDKIPDLVVSHAGFPWGLGLLKGNGDGTFQPEQQIVTNVQGVLNVQKIAASDLNGDGKEDLILSDVSAGGVRVLLGNGDGTFQPYVNYASGANPYAFGVKDVNGDGNIDLEIVDQQSNHIAVLLGNGDGTFSPRSNLPPPPTSPVPMAATGAVVGDFNKDGIPDLAISQASSDYNGFGVVAVLLGKGKGVFQAPIDSNTDGGSGPIVATDFNGDGQLDVAVSNGNGAAVLLGNGDGSFGAPIQVVNTLAMPARGIVTGDFNNDGKQDLVVVANPFSISNPIFVILGNGDGTFQTPKQFWNSTSLPTQIAAGDFNHDGKLDLVVVLNPNGIAVMLGNGDGTFQSSVTYPTDELPTGLSVADLNGDNIPDIVAIGNMADIYLGKGDGTFAAPVYYNAGEFPLQVITGDFNADGKADLAVTAEGSGAIGDLEILLGNGDGTFLPPVEIADGAAVGTPLAAGDLNEDGTVDTPMSTLSPTSINFGSINVGSTGGPANITLTNSGNAPLQLSAVTATTEYAVTNTCGPAVGPRLSCALGVSFAPTASGPSAGVITLTDNAPLGRQVVALAGSGQADFSLAISSGSSGSATVTAGSPASYDLSAIPLGGFNQNVSFTCTGAPPSAVCTVSPSSATFSANAPLALTVQVSTMAAATVKTFPTDSRPLRKPLLPEWFVSMMLFFLVLAHWSRQINARQHPPRVVTVVFLFAILLGLSGCGGSGSSNPSGGTGGTLAGTYTLTVTASSGSGSTILQHNVKLTLIVN